MTFLSRLATSTLILDPLGILKSLNKAKQNEAAGADGVSYEFLKALPHNWLLDLISLFNKIFDSGVALPRWSKVMFMLDKKGDTTDPGNYRDIALVNCIAKIFTQTIHDRINSWAELNGIILEEQTGFRSGRSCADVFVLQALLQSQARFKDVSSYALFIDFKRTFDSVPHF